LIDEEPALGGGSEDDEAIALGGTPEDDEDISLGGVEEDSNALAKAQVEPQPDTVEGDFFRRGPSGYGMADLSDEATSAAKDQASEVLESLPISALSPLATMDLDRGVVQAPAVSGAVKATPLRSEGRQRPAKAKERARAAAEEFPEVGTESAITFAVPPPRADAGDAPSDGSLVERIAEQVGEVVGVRLPGEDYPLPEGEPPMALPARYTWLASLGEGGQGSVELVIDQDLGRSVALKTLHAHKEDRADLLDLYRESRITGQLEHPHIIPIYDVGQLPDGRLYYTMPRLPGESLHHVLALRRRGNVEVLAKWSLVPLLQVLEKVCHGVGYAHAHGVIHRDLKPANILLGSHGEVLVVDWGIARVVHGTGGARGRLWSRQGEEKVERVRGSPPYMAPEQVKHPDQVSPAADVFCLGVILYEVLTRESPFPGAALDEIVEMLCHERPVPPRERAPELRIPAELEEICLRALEKFPGHRYANASELAGALGDFLSGGRRRESAARRLREAESLRSRYRVLVRRKEDGWVELDAGRQAIGEATSDEESERLQRLRNRVASLERAADGVFSEAVWSLHRALADDPENREVQAVLGELYGDRYAEAEWLSADREQAFFRAMLRQFDDGRWSRWLRSGAELQLETIPEDTPMGLYRLHETGHRLEPGELIPPDSHNNWQLAPGRYAVAPLPTAADSDPTAPARWFYPLLLDREARRHVIIDLRGEERSGERFCFVPGGPALVGGDRLAAGSSYRDNPYIAPFAIARNPVTVGAYARFLDWLASHDPVEARIRNPVDHSNRGQADDRRPITGISHDDALAYCEWLQGATGVVLRLPTAAEWEKASRGADGRRFPWGDRIEPGLCASLDLGIPQGPPPPVGSFPEDRSPFGMEDAAGGVWEWTSTALPGNRHIVMGGSIATEPESCRCAGRRALAASTKLHFLGFRVLLELN
jgi:serine/threonine-protein kinase